MSDIQFTPAYISNNLNPRNPQVPFRAKMQNSYKKLNVLFSEKYGQVSDYAAGASTGFINKSKLNLNKFKKYFRKSFFLPLFIIVAAIVGIYFLANLFKGNSSTVLSDTDQRVNIKQAKARQDLNKEFLFPLKDSKGKVVSKIKYSLQDVQLQDEIIVKGQRATAVKGRTFLIVYLKITNDYNQDISLKTRDYIRLMVNNNSEKLAPDIHNDPVDIQAISTKYTRLGFPINDSDTNIILQVGEINGTKQNIKLDKLK